MVYQRACADFGAAKVEQDRYGRAEFGRDRADSLNRFGVALLRAVRHIDARNVHPG
jgi:hypothetical protein